MYSVLETEQFSAWLMGLKDRTTRAVAVAAAQGHARQPGGPQVRRRPGLGDARELRPWLELYYTLRGTTLIVMLAGGDKSSQARDIERAKAMVLELLDGQNQNPPV